MTPEEQMMKWLEGNSIHDMERDECCPDFSCCKPELQADEATRRQFVERPELRVQMLGFFLTAMLANASKDGGKKVYVVTPNEEGNA